MKTNLRISGKKHRVLKEHLYPGDGLEAVAFLLCSRHQYGSERHLLVCKVVPIPYHDCLERSHDKVTWSTKALLPLLQEATKKDQAVVKVHSHPTGYRSFSMLDDTSDEDLYSSIFGWLQTEEPQASAVMLPDGEIFARLIYPDLTFAAVEKMTLVGDDLRFWYSEKTKSRSAFNLRTEQALGTATTTILKSLKVAVVGCSGTGSPTIEQIVRLGVGHLVLLDPDHIEEKNLNRILNSTMEDALENQPKVAVFERAIAKMGLGTKVTAVKGRVCLDKEVVSLLASCDVIFGCVDSVDGRNLLNHISTFYLVPYFDLGVKVLADGRGGVDQICGTIHYVQPGGSSLRTRGLYSPEDLRAESLHQADPSEYQIQRKAGYIANVNVDSPAVISINMLASSLAINEFLARIHLFRNDPNESFAIRRFSLTDSYFQCERDGEPDPYLERFVGHGTTLPLLNMVGQQ